MNSIETYVQENKKRFIDELIELLKIPSISADPACKNDIIKTAIAVKSSSPRSGGWGGWNL